MTKPDPKAAEQVARAWTIRRLVAQRLIVEQVGLPRNQANFVPISRGLDGIDPWLAVRVRPDWPIRG